MSGVLTRYCETLRGRSVAVLGAGVSNKPLIALLLKNGVAVTVRDASGAEKFPAELLAGWTAQGAKLRLGEGYLEELTEDVIFRSPGVMPHTPQLARAVKVGSVLTSEMEAFMALCPCPITAVTGSDGKTTTTTLIAGLLKAAGYKTWLGGNIGTPLLDKVEEMAAGDKVVLELSSFQLMTMPQSAQVAVVTNVAPNHLDKHTDMDEYVAAKENVFAHQGVQGKVVLNFDNAITRDFAQKAPGQVVFFSRQVGLEDGVCVRDGAIWRKGVKVLDLSGITIPGAHNVENFMAAIAAVEGLVDDETVRRFAGEFGGVEHRIELVREIGKVRYYNDSIASSPSRTIAGLRSFDRKVILIAGGYDKHIPFDVLGPEVVAHAKRLYLTGDTAQKIRRAVEGAAEFDPAALPIVETADLREAVEAAHRAAEPGDVVLMSPACASFDRYKNFMERGEAFKAMVAALPER